MVNCIICGKQLKDVTKKLCSNPECSKKYVLEATARKKREEVPEEYLKVLKNPGLFNEITEAEFDKKIVGEVESRKVIFLNAQGRLIENSQIASYNVLVNDDAGAGKDYMTSKVLEILPEGVYIHKTRISPTAFTYWHTKKKEPDWTWNGKVLYPEDISEAVLNSEVFKVMCSGGSSATIVIRNKAVDLEIEGKPVIITTTATAVPNPELTRRFSILNLDSSQNQTRAIMKRHSEFKKQGLIPEYNPKYKEAMKFLQRVKVKIPFADLIDQHFPIQNIMMRTNYSRFLDLICASSGFHQFQRKRDNEDFVLAEGQDYDIARTCFLKLCSNKYMISLTINQKKILENFENNPTLSGSVSQLHSRNLNFLSLSALQTNLGLLVRYGILETTTQKDTWNRDIEIFSLCRSYNPNVKISIPTFQELTLIPLRPIIPLTSIIPLTPSSIGVGSKDIQGINKVQKGLNNIPNFDDIAENFPK